MCPLLKKTSQQECSSLFENFTDDIIQESAVLKAEIQNQGNSGGTETHFLPEAKPTGLVEAMSVRPEHFHILGARPDQMRLTMTHMTHYDSDDSV